MKQSKTVFLTIGISVAILIGISLFTIRAQALEEKNLIIDSMIPPLKDCPSSGLIGAFECWNMKIDDGIMDLNNINKKYGILISDPQTDLRERAVRALDQNSECDPQRKITGGGGGLIGALEGFTERLEAMNAQLKCVTEIMEGKR